MNDQLVCFLYLLMRDDLPMGRVAELVKESTVYKGKFVFTNKHLEAYAKDLVKRLGKK